MRTWYPARNKGVDTAKIPRGAVASILENAGKKKTTFRDGMIDRAAFQPSLFRFRLQNRLIPYSIYTCNRVIAHNSRLYTSARLGLASLTYRRSRLDFFVR